MIWMYGGSFNPPTKAHQIIIETIQRHVPSDQIFIVPVGNHYHKASLIDFKHRKDMLHLMDETLEILDIEQKHPFLGTIHTLQTIQSKTNQDVGFIIGADQLKDINNWIQYETLIRTYPMLIITRPLYDITPYLDQLKDLEATYQIINIELNVSSTKFRDTHDEELLHPSVYAYIKKYHLYEE